MPDFVPVVYSDGTPVLSSAGPQRVACAHLAAWLVAVTVVAGWLADALRWLG